MTVVASKFNKKIIKAFEKILAEDSQFVKEIKISRFG